MDDSDQEVQFNLIRGNGSPRDELQHNCQDRPQDHVPLEADSGTEGQADLEPEGNDISETEEVETDDIREVNVLDDDNRRRIATTNWGQRSTPRSRSPNRQDRRNIDYPRDRRSREVNDHNDEEVSRSAERHSRRREKHDRQAKRSRPVDYRDSDDSDYGYSGEQQNRRLTDEQGSGRRRTHRRPFAVERNQGDFLGNNQQDRPHRSNLPVIKPEKFDGTGDWESYFSHFTNCADLGKWSDEEKALTLASSLQGSASIFYLGLQEYERRIFRTLVKLLTDRFGSRKQQTKYIARLETRKRNDGETLASFGDDLRIMAQRAYPDLDNNARESLALHQFYKTISPEMKCRCLDRECRTIQQAVNVVERYELVLGTEDKRRNTVRMVKGCNVTGSTGKTDECDTEMKRQMHDILTRLDRMESRLNGRHWQHPNETTDNDRRGKRFTGCFICKSMQHYARDCPQKRDSNDNKTQKSENSRPLA